MVLRMLIALALVSCTLANGPPPRQACRFTPGQESFYDPSRVQQFLACIQRNNGRYHDVYVNQPMCSALDPPITQAVAKIDKVGVLTLSDGSSLDYHLKGVISFQTINLFQTRIYAVFTGVRGFFQDSKFFSLHVHELGEINASCLSTGGHFNPCNKEHSDDPNVPNRHIGDVAKVELNPNSDLLIIDRVDSQVKLGGPLSVAGRSVTVHAGAGAPRVGCATIGITKWDGEDTRHPDTFYEANPQPQFWQN